MTTPRSTPPRHAFTLVEVLVVIAVISILLSILLPGLAGAKSAAQLTRELAAAQQLTTGYFLYADDHRGVLMPGYAPASMTSIPSPPGAKPLTVLDEDGAPITGVQAQRYPWRLYPYLDYNFAGIYFDPKILSRYRGSPDFHYYVSLSPSLGLNSTFIGGDADRYGFNPAATGVWGPFYLTSVSQASRPDNLLLFASARGAAPDGDSSPVPGYFRVDAPYLLSRQWSPSFDPARAPGSFGHVDLRYQKRAVTGAFDGHAATLGEEPLQDMRRWCERATTPQWTLGTSR
ncbi:MAG: type II secretion system protein [Phycisphaeraceae bacterium]|nr:type II secretion system protein [Phycisphaeraceae bacterium]